MNLVRWIVLPPITLVMIAFAIANRHPVTVSLSPLPYEVEVPLYAIVFAGIFLGLLFGGVAAWLRQGRWRKKARGQGREINRLSEENDHLRASASRDIGAQGDGKSLSVSH